MPDKTLPEWLSYIEQLHHSAIDMGLSRVVQIANSLSLTEFDCPVITIAGTNGKGSCVACLESVYQEAGLKVAVYTSPHITQFNERIRYKNEAIDDESLQKAFLVVDAERIDLNITLSFFEFTTLAACWIFKQKNPDVILLEVGLGGRLDATNVVENDIGVITSIALDHMDWLGSTREAILTEKMGIARAGCPLVFGDENPPQNLVNLIASYQARPFIIGQDYRYRSQDSEMIWQYEGEKISLKPPLFLKHQNVATALMVIQVMQKQLPVALSQIQAGIAKVVLPGRFEILSSCPLIIVDVAHNAAATEWLAVQLKRHYKDIKISAVFGVMKDKDLEPMIKPMLPLIDRWFLADLPLARSAPASVVSEKLNAYDVKQKDHYSNVESALSAAICVNKDADEKSAILVFGSFYAVAGAKNYFRD